MKTRAFLYGRTAIISMLIAAMGARPARLAPTEAANDPEYNFEFLWQTFDRNYALFQAKHVDWRALYNVYRLQVTAKTSDDELFAVMSRLLGYLNDNHVRLASTSPQRYFGAGYLWDQFNKSGMTKLRAYLRQRPVPDKRFRAPLQESGNKVFAHGWLDGAVGYIHFNAFVDAEGSARAIDIPCR